MTDTVLKATTRTDSGSATARRLRRAGRIPGVVYGQKKETVNIELDARDLEAALRLNARVLDLDVGGDVERTLVKELQLDTYGQKIRHIDLLRVVIGETITTDVGLEYFGTPRGVSEDNGVLVTPVDSIQIECTPSDIPSAMGDRVRVKDLVAVEGVKILEDEERILASVSAAKEEEEEEDDALLDGPAEPEVIGGGPGEDSGGSKDQ